jgi:hypothetical protein
VGSKRQSLLSHQAAAEADEPCVMCVICYQSISSVVELTN